MILAAPAMPAWRRAATGLAWGLVWTLAWGLAIAGFAHRPGLHRPGSGAEAAQVRAGPPTFPGADLRPRR